MKKVIYFLILASFQTSLFAQTIEWERSFPSIEINIGVKGFGNDVAQTTDGGFILAGADLYPNSLGNFFIRVLKTDDQGNVEWDNTFHSINDFTRWEGGESVFETEDGGFLISGQTSRNFFENSKIFLMKLSADGDSLWTKKYQHFENNLSRAMVQSNDGGFVLAGEVRNFQDHATVLLKVDGEGDSLWLKTYFPHESSTGAYDIQTIALPLGGGGYVATGVFNNDILLFATDGTGELLWSKTYDFSPMDIGLSVRQTPDEGFIIGGATMDPDTHFPILIKTDASGNIEWTTTPGIGASGSVNAVRPTPDGGYVVCGAGLGFFSQYFNSGYLQQLDENGNEIWTIDFEGEQTNALNVEMAQDGGFIAGGNSQGGMFLLKTGGVTATTTPSEQKAALRIFPNPLTHSATLELTDSKPQTHHFDLFDSLGRRIKKAFFEGTSFQFLREELPAGIYFFQIKDEKEMLVANGTLIAR